ncbi:MAG: hypothetical protein AAGF07_01045 [Patescibacteria group bacterium]
MQDFRNKALTLLIIAAGLSPATLNFFNKPELKGGYISTPLLKVNGDEVKVYNNQMIHILLTYLLAGGGLSLSYVTLFMRPRS